MATWGELLDAYREAVAVYEATGTDEAAEEMLAYETLLETFDGEIP